MKTHVVYTHNNKFSHTHAMQLVEPTLYDYLPADWGGGVSAYGSSPFLPPHGYTYASTCVLAYS